MEWQSESQAVSQFVRGHIPFDIGILIVICVMGLSAIFSWVNRPSRAADQSIKTALESFKNNDPDQLKLLWEYALHSDQIFSDRQNFFLLFESILLGGTFAVIAATTQIHNGIMGHVITLIAFLGLITAVCWWYIQMRQEYVLDCLTTFHRLVTPVYADVILRIRQKPYRLGSTLILVYILPVLVGLLWSVILLFV